jgi:hypothetical protein
MRSSRRVKAVLASASIFVVAGVANAVTDTWVGNVAPTNGLTYPANTGNWEPPTGATAARTSIPWEIRSFSPTISPASRTSP